MKKNRYNVVGTVCECGNKYMPPREVCECGETGLKSFVFSGFGEIISFTTIHVGPAGFEMNTPYNVALIKLEEGPVISGVVVDEKIEIGQKVKGVFRKLHTDGEEGLINYGFKFELAS